MKQVAGADIARDTPDGEPTIAGAAVTPGHDGLAEMALDIRYPNGAVRTISVTSDAIAPLLDRAGVTDLDGLVGRSWSVLLA